jgi:hypothetical protein
MSAEKTIRMMQDKLIRGLERRMKEHIIFKILYIIAESSKDTSTVHFIVGQH